MQSIDIEYGDRTMAAEVPDHAIIVRAGVSYTEPAPVDPFDAARVALASPLGHPTIRELVGDRSRVVVAFPDRVKGGTHEHSHRKVTIPLVLQELVAAGVREDNITLICAEGLHRKNTREEMRGYLPESVVDGFGPDRLRNHDAEDPDGIVDFGTSRHGDPVQFNRACAEADLCIVLGHVQGNPYGGFSGGYKTYTTGLTTWRSIAGHHVPATMHRDDFVPISTKSHFRGQLRAIGEVIESRTAGPVFVVDAVLGDGARVLGMWAGATRAVEESSWALAKRRTEVELDIEPVDVVLFGLPRDFHYGPGMGTNPILVAQAIAATTARVAGALRPGGVVIAAALCDGWFNAEWFPSYPETFERYLTAHSVADMARDLVEVCGNADFVRAYRDAGGYHPFHGFSMLSMAEIALQRTSRVIVVGAGKPGYARAMGLLPARTVAEALSEAERLTGPNPSIMVLPEFLTHIPPHLYAARA